MFSAYMNTCKWFQFAHNLPNLFYVLYMCCILGLSDFVNCGLVKIGAWYLLVSRTLEVSFNIFYHMQIQRTIWWLSIYFLHDKVLEIKEPMYITPCFLVRKWPVLGSSHFLWESTSSSSYIMLWEPDWFSNIYIYIYIFGLVKID